MVCVYKGCQTNLTIDHLIPITKNGTNAFNNLVVACQSCNSSKSNKDVIEWCKEKNIKVPLIVLELLDKQKEQTNLLNIL